MVRFLIIIVVLMCLSSKQSAAVDDPFLVTQPTQAAPMGEVISEAQCFNVINKAPYTVYGSINTNYFVTSDGIKTRHKSNFRLSSQEKVEFCTYGPFYEGRKLELVLRTLLPIFNCKTGVTEDVIIYGRRKSEGGTETYAVCL